MVLGISLRGKKKKEEPSIPTSPSLPSVLAQGIPWPENLVDINEVKAVRKSSIQQPDGGKTSVSYHRPFRTGSPSSDGPTAGTIASFFTSKGAQIGGYIRSAAHPTLSLSRSQRRRVAPTLNIMVAGPRSTGKTSMLKLFLETSEISSTATPEQKLSVETFMTKSRKSTRSLQTVCVEIAETRYDRILLTLIDTPGLSYAEGEELSLERSVSALVKYLDQQYDETMGEESKVVRQSKGDQHVHLCIYCIDPDSIMTANARRAKSRLPNLTRSTVTVSLSNKDDAGHESSDNESDFDDGAHHHNNLTMNPAEIRIIKRLAARVNVLPVIARTDSLTESRLRAIKRTVRRELVSAGVGFGVFSPSSTSQTQKASTASNASTAIPSSPTESSATVGSATESNNPEDASAPQEEEEEEEERQARPVIRIRSRKSFTGERSRSRRRRSGLADPSPERSDEEVPLPKSEHHTTGGGGRLSKAALEALLPFALVSPQPRRRGEPIPSETNSEQAQRDQLHPSDVEAQTPRSQRSPVPPSSFPSQFQGHHDEGASREFPKGKFVRHYKWGSLDVLDPAHCDFVALRTSVFSTHFKALKINTREVLYEKYRTDKLLARRATRNISKEDRTRLLQDLGL
ncbi:hypothetical protein FRB91_006140 [Serendipita sp. 411]|nr:hypothetical protein FRC18_011055 [Serendipita sp. 400]KAG8852663.1 hypothetical protein FRB91_006140 [Serendipita sp. 411]